MRFFIFLHNGKSSVELLLVKHDNWSMFEQKNFDKKKNVRENDCFVSYKESCLIFWTRGDEKVH